MRDLVEKLNAALDAEERIARAALSHPSKYDPATKERVRDGTDDGEWSTGYGAGDVCRVEGIGINIYDEGGHSEEQARHIAFQDPKRALRRVAAHRKILARHSSGDWPYDPEGRSDAGGYSLTEYCDGCNKPVPCPDLLDLAEEYDLTDDSAETPVKNKPGGAEVAARIVEELDLPY